jgi:hypothetical protein
MPSLSTINLNIKYKLPEMTTNFKDKAGVDRFSQTRSAKMQEIIPRLWLGSKAAVDDKQLLATHGITHILTVMRTFVDESGALSTQMSSETCQFYDSATGVSRFIVPVDDFPRRISCSISPILPNSYWLLFAAVGQFSYIA